MKMRLMFLGDDRDLFKYDLIKEVYSAVESVDHVYFIPMLTPDVESTHGKVCKRKKGAPGSKNTRLVSHLDRCRLEGVRDLTPIIDYFTSEGIPIRMHKGDLHLSKANRREYFSIPATLDLANALVFFDPDNGLEIERSTECHLLVDEVATIFNSMGAESIIMIFQYRPRVDMASVVDEKTRRLLEGGLPRPLVIAESNLAFLFIAKQDEILSSLSRVLEEHSSNYENMNTWNLLDQ